MLYCWIGNDSGFAKLFLSLFFWAPFSSFWYKGWSCSRSLEFAPGHSNRKPQDQAAHRTRAELWRRGSSSSTSKTALFALYCYDLTSFLVSLIPISILVSLSVQGFTSSLEPLHIIALYRHQPQRSIRWLS